MTDSRINAHEILEEAKAVNSAVVGDLMEQLIIQRAINRQQEQTIIMLRSRIEVLTQTEQ